MLCVQASLLFKVYWQDLFGIHTLVLWHVFTQNSQSNRIGCLGIAENSIMFAKSSQVTQVHENAFFSMMSQFHLWHETSNKEATWGSNISTVHPVRHLLSSGILLSRSTSNITQQLHWYKYISNQYVQHHYTPYPNVPF